MMLYRLEVVLVALISFTFPFVFYVSYSFAFAPFWAVIWTTIQLVGKSLLNSQDYQISFTCKAVVGYFVVSIVWFICSIDQIVKKLKLGFVLVCSSCCYTMATVASVNQLAACLTITTYLGIFRLSWLTCQACLFCMVSNFLGLLILILSFKQPFVGFHNSLVLLVLQTAW